MDTYSIIHDEVQQLFSNELDQSEEVDLFNNSLFQRQLYLPLTTRYAHLNPQRQSVLDQLRNNPPKDPLRLPEIYKSNEMVLHDSNSTFKPVKSDVFTGIVNSLTPDIIPSNVSNKAIKPIIGEWKLQNVVVGHMGHVTALCADPQNEFYVSGSTDATIKFWNDVNELQLTLTGHIMTVRGVKVSGKMPYLFSCSEDKTVKCWDLEKNKVIRDYHGHLSAVYALDLNDNKGLIMTGGRDSSVRIWDIRTRNEIMLLSGHKSSVTKIECLASENELVSSSMDSTVKKWDFRTGKCLNTLTYHSKGVRSFAVTEDELITGSTNGLKKFRLNSCEYLEDIEYFGNHDRLSGNIIVNTMSASNEGVLFAGCDDGRYGFWDVSSGQLLQESIQIPTPGSLEGEKAIITSMFKDSTTLITGSMDKSIKVYKRFEN